MIRNRILLAAGVLAWSLSAFAADPAAPTLQELLEHVPSAYRHRIVQQLSIAEGNAEQMRQALETAPADHLP
ncbi:MAG TPA: hypothetical protein VG897_03945, partial [Terriglobales bacterium]|nr:hypothetical protein [Terriglobales bacterium]